MQTNGVRCYMLQQVATMKPQTGGTNFPRIYQHFIYLCRLYCPGLLQKFWTLGGLEVLEPCLHLSWREGQHRLKRLERLKSAQVSLPDSYRLLSASSWGNLSMNSAASIAQDIAMAHSSH